MQLMNQLKRLLLKKMRNGKRTNICQNKLRKPKQSGQPFRNECQPFPPTRDSDFPTNSAQQFQKKGPMPFRNVFRDILVNAGIISKISIFAKPEVWLTFEQFPDHFFDQQAGQFSQVIRYGINKYDTSRDSRVTNKSLVIMSTCDASGISF